MLEELNYYKKIKLVEPRFDSNLIDLIIELDHLRKKKLGGSTHPLVFFQLKEIFHTMESIGSARIEGNNTTVSEYIETKLDENSNTSESIKEIKNIEEAMRFIEETIDSTKINRAFISEIHKVLVKDLTPYPKGEGDLTPGGYRKKNVKISKSPHVPPDFLMVEEYMDELFEFIQRDDSAKYDLLKIAIAHHRFAWIHPFGNGNGRTVRLFTYAMLVNLGFNVNVGRILNPTAVFCNNREKYYQYLSLADTGEDDGILQWCEYVLMGLRDEIEKIDKLLDYDYLKKEILLPAIDISIERKYVTEVESKILKRVVEKQTIMANDIKDIFSNKVASEISRQIKNLINKKMLIPESAGRRKYVIRFDNNYLLRSIIKILDEKGFLPANEATT